MLGLRVSGKVGAMPGVILMVMDTLIYGRLTIGTNRGLYRNNRDGTFTNVIDEVWSANPDADTHGAAWADFDNDGDQDLIILSGSGGGLSSSGHNNHANHFYVNEGGRLIERAAELGVDYPLLRGRTPLWFDWNRDGRLDVLLTGVSRTDKTGARFDSSFFAQTNGRFENMNRTSGFVLEKSVEFAQLSGLTQAAESLHLIFGSHSHVYPVALYEVSDVFFRDVTDTLPIPGGYVVQDAAVADMNGDLLPDIFLARSIYPSYVGQLDPYRLELNIQSTLGVTSQQLSVFAEKGISFKTDGEVHFEIYSEWGPRQDLVKIGAAGHKLTEFKRGEFIAVRPNLRAAAFKVKLSPDDPRVFGIKARPESEQFGIYLGYDRDARKWTILYHKLPATTLIEATEPISDVETIRFFPSVDLHANLLVNRGIGFEPLPMTSGIGLFSDSHSVAAGDFDNDMDIDLYVVRSSTAENLPNHLYENQGDGTFVHLWNIGEAAGSRQGRGQSVTMADYDCDGHLDLFVTNGRGMYPFSEGPDQLFHNLGSDNNWLQIDLEGTFSNRDGIGAKLFATTPDGKTQLRENGGGIHWAQQDQKRIHFGLAQHEKVSELVIHWPSGIVQKLKDIPVNQVLRIVERNVQVSLRGDVNQDGVVDILDLVVVVKHFGESPPTKAVVDVNQDGIVNILDLIVISNSLKKTEKLP